MQTFYHYNKEGVHVCLCENIHHQIYMYTCASRLFYYTCSLGALSGVKILIIRISSTTSIQVKLCYILPSETIYKWENLFEEYKMYINQS
jgi:hypothetical protein